MGVFCFVFFFLSFVCLGGLFGFCLFSLFSFHYLGEMLLFRVCCRLVFSFFRGTDF